MKIRKPIFIIGSGRSGTTLLYTLLAAHPDLCWFSNISDRYAPFAPIIFLHRLKNVFGLVPSEGGRIYHELCHFENRKKTTQRDLSLVDTKLFFHIIESHLCLTDKPRFLNKQTANTQRLRLMHALFPDAYWLHIIRDGRAVAHSLSRVSWWPTVELWWHGGETPMELQRRYKDPIVLASEHWKRNVTEICRVRGIFGHRYTEVRYEALVKHPEKVLREILIWSGLPVSKEYLRSLPHELQNRNGAWQKNFSTEQKKLVNKNVATLLQTLGYPL